MGMYDDITTLPTLGRDDLVVPESNAFLFSVLDGASAGKTFSATTDRVAIGSHPSNDLVLDDRKVSRFHAEVLLDPRGARVRDLGSRNATMVDGVEVVEARLKDGSVLRVGESSVRFAWTAGSFELPVSPLDHFGGLVGQSLAMRGVFYLLERATRSEATVLITGETGTGKDVAAESVHAASSRRQGPFVVVDCTSLPANLIESELFGHEKGAFTGAIAAHAGAFEAADHGTIFLDEIGELPLEQQSRLLRVLEDRSVQRVGSAQRRSVDVRVMAATHRNVLRAVSEGSFRSDLYFRLAVICVRLPPLRERPEDIPLIARSLINAIRVDPDVVARVVTPQLMERLKERTWPGNVRELRNYLEQALLLETIPPPAMLAEPQAVGASQEKFDPEEPFSMARQRALAHFEQRYLQWLLARHGGNVAHAAAAAGIDRSYIHRMLRRRPRARLR